MPGLIYLKESSDGDEVITQQSIDRLPDGHKFLARRSRSLVERLASFVDRFTAWRERASKINKRDWSQHEE